MVYDSGRFAPLYLLGDTVQTPVRSEIWAYEKPWFYDVYVWHGKVQVASC